MSYNSMTPISVKIPVNSNERCYCSMNGVTYEVGEIKNACNINHEDVPIYQYDSKQGFVRIGVAKTMKYNDGLIDVNGGLYSCQ